MFPLETFRLLYPQFADVPDDVVLAFAVQAECYLGTHGCECSDGAWMLLVAHLLQLRANAEQGNSAPGALTSATVGSVSVSFQAAAEGNAWEHWLNLSPFGQQLLALQAACFNGGKYIGGSPERAAFRQAYGRFPRGRC